MKGDLEMGWESDRLTQGIIGCIIKVHQTLGPGYLETTYRNALVIELRKRGYHVETEKEVVILYEGVEVGRHRPDVLVESKVIVELKAVEELSRAHYAQVRAFLKATGLRTGILVNFSTPVADYRRVQPA